MGPLCKYDDLDEGHLNPDFFDDMNYIVLEVLGEKHVER